MNGDWKSAVDRFVAALEASPVLRAYRDGGKPLPPKPRRGADPSWGRTEGTPDVAEIEEGDS